MEAGRDDRRGCAADLEQFVERELDPGGAAQVLDLGRVGRWDEDCAHRRIRERPRERHMARWQAALASDLRDRTAGRVAHRIGSENAARVLVVGRAGVGRPDDEPEALVAGKIPELLP